jgi:predicted GTPase
MSKTNLDSLNSKVSNLREVVKKYSFLEQLNKRLDQINEKFKNKEVIIPLIGEFSSGKTSLVNSLIGADILPIDITPTTFTINEIRFSCEKDKIEIYSQSELTRQIDGLSPIKDEDIQNASLVRIFSKSKTVPAGVVLVDSPGISSGIERHEKILLEYVPKSDALIVVIDVNQGSLTRSLEEFLKGVSKIDKASYVVFTKSETKSPEDINDLREYAVSKLPIKPKGIVFTSSKEGRVEEFSKILSEIGSNAEDILLKNIIEDLLRVCDEGISLLDLQISMSNIDTNEIDAKIAETKRALEKMRNEFDRNISDMRDRIRSAQSSMVSIFRMRMMGGMDRIVDMLLSGDKSKVESALDDLIRESATDAIDKYKDELSSVMNQLRLDIENITKKIDVGPDVDVSKILDPITFTIMSVLLDLVLPGGLIYGVLAELLLNLVGKFPKFKVIFTLFQEPIEHIISQLIKPITRRFINDKMQKIIDNAVIEFKSVIEKETSGILSELERKLDSSFKESEKSVMDSLNNLRSEKEKKVSEFSKYVSGLRNDKYSLESFKNELKTIS